MTVVVPIRGVGRVMGHLARYINKIGGSDGIFQSSDLVL